MSKITDALEGCQNLDQWTGTLLALSVIDNTADSEKAALMLIKKAVQAGARLNDNLRLADAAREAARFLQGRH